MPGKATFQAAAAIAKQLWNTLARFLEVENYAGERIPLRKFATTAKNAGASRTCGIPNVHGISRRIICHNHPGTSIGMAVLLKWAGNSKEHLM